MDKKTVVTKINDLRKENNAIILAHNYQTPDGTRYGIYNNLTISGARTINTVALSASGTIGIAGVFNPSATFTTGGYSTTGSTIDFNGVGGTQTIPRFNYNNVTCSNGTKTQVTNLVIGGNFLINSSYG
jgi:hypothetical protein